MDTWEESDRATYRGARRRATLDVVSGVLSLVVERCNDVVADDGLGATSSGTCSLRAAIRTANQNPGTDLISFNIPGSGVHDIYANSLHPTIEDNSGGVTIGSDEYDIWNEQNYTGANIFVDYRIGVGVNGAMSWSDANSAQY